MSELSNDQHVPESTTDHMQQPDTDIPGVWRCQVEPKSDLYGDSVGKLMDPEKVVKGRLTELNHMNDHHVYDWIDEADIPKSTKIESRAMATRAMSGVVLSCSSTMLSHEMKSIKARHHWRCRGCCLRWPRAKTHTARRCVESGTSAWRSFILRWMSTRWCDHRLACE